MRFILSAIPWLSLGLLLLLGGCASYSNSFTPIALEIAQQNPAGALKLLDKEKTPERNRLLLLMNRGLLLRMQGRFVASNQVFSAAKQLAEKLDALSLREQTAALAINDAMRSYAGTPYERVMLNLYSALNYLDLGQLDDARVEALQIDLLLAQLGDDEVGPLFDNDPLARYLAGLIYESTGEISDAMISYRRAYQAYLEHQNRYALAVPRQLQRDLLRVSDAVGLTEENQQYRADFALDHWQSAARKKEQGELIFIFNNGLAPIKVEQSLTVPVPPRGQLVRVALPAYVKRPGGFSAARLEIADQVFETEIFENIEDLAIAELERNQPAMLARAIARNILKYRVTKEAGKKDDFAGFLVNLTGIFTERADTRSWMSLPANIQLARVTLPPGTYDLKVDLLDTSGQPVKTLDYPKVLLTAGHKTYLSCTEVAPDSLQRKN